VLALRSEMENLEVKPLSEAEIAALHPAVAPLRKKFDVALLKYSTVATQLEIKRLDAYAKQLGGLKKELTKAGDLEGAIEVQKLEEAAEKRGGELRVAVPGAVPIPEEQSPPRLSWRKRLSPRAVFVAARKTLSVSMAQVATVAAARRAST
jgi:hypothetical protein